MSIPNALVGFTGFVGQTLLRQNAFDEQFNSSNSATMAGQSFSTVYFSAARAEKWKANADPDADAVHIENLIKLLGSFKAERLVLISTIDVYEVPNCVDERNNILPKPGLNPYGNNRLRLEQAAQALFDKSNIIRLPALFGTGLKKNAIFDLMNDNNVERINPDGMFQFYNMDYLDRDLQRAIDLELPLLNICSQPVRIGDIAQQIFNRDIEDNDRRNPAVYDVQSVFANSWGGENYLYTRDSVESDLHRFINFDAAKEAIS